MLLPNQLTVLRIILTPVFFFLFLSGEPLLIQISALVYIIAAITDWYDGWLARKFNYITEWGKFLDPLADKILTSAAFLALVLVGILELWMVSLIIFRDILITGLRIWADYKRVSFSTSKTAKWKTFFQMAFQYYLLLIYTLKSFDSLNREYTRLFEILFDKDFIYYTMLAITIFTVYTGITYFISNWSLIKKIIGYKN
ncbi:CDP-diacylglycerol/glycerol-3-phosphate 3-phosphatidyltransferase [Melioribacter roseus P3M-2]|uniref:CDP-diacylglycerol--glycerol-3-phosphate 3-phosphatidyltransferase n=1 Tax=Melioribacter roseus (strain DSM 23840 / JCM 17771 / VKM B-2668 / P3M-2) TaxID=1191523 RepID=I6YYL4_MELRP|nr:CDP-diacylglycerol--glycerol-3-phosphate 3-phosphatidyltransferase [Melioribacter roseus]AFN75662.1 CDP-diacylglycerol/glycerol-3-phosphate 3-phosphatidyltransferase [Melioribacter roseus P3M-2]